MILEHLKISDIDELYLEVGNGKYSSMMVVNLIYKKEEEPSIEKIKKPIIKNSDTDILVSGIDKVKVNLANCCSPIPGDDIIGYITKGNGISVHRANCHNLEVLERRNVDVYWSDAPKERYQTTILIHCNTKEDKLLEMLQKINMQDASIDKFVTMSKGDDTVYEADLYVKSLSHLLRVFSELDKLSYVTRIEMLMK